LGVKGRNPFLAQTGKEVGGGGALEGKRFMWADKGRDISSSGKGRKKGNK